MDSQGHCRCEEHAVRYRPRSPRPAWYVSAQHLNAVLHCGLCATAGRTRRGGLVFGAATLDTRIVQFTNQAAYCMSDDELQHKTVLWPHGRAV